MVETLAIYKLIKSMYRERFLREEITQRIEVEKD